MVSKTKIILPVAIVALAVSALMFQIRHTYQNQTAESTAAEEETEEGELALSDEQIRNGGIEMRKAGPGKLKLSITLPGKIAINPESYAHLVTHSAGIVKEARHNIGDKVEAGEVLALIESKEIAEAKAAYLTADRRERLAITLLQKEKILKDKKVGAEQEYLQAEALADEARMEKELARQRLFSLGLSEQEITQLPNRLTTDLRLYEIKAPFSGTIINRHLTRGETVEAGQEAYVIADLNTVRIELGIYPKDLPSAREGQKIQILNDLGENADAQVIKLSPIVDPESSRVKVVAQLDNRKGNWRPGTYVTARLNVGEFTSPLVVPQEAVVKMENQDYVFIQHEGHFEKRPVTVGRSDGQATEIVAGLKPGDPYVAKNAFILKFELTKGEPD
jgi:cobalt-zinc-cadmium efflux system membrane fusion protein